MLRWVVTLFRDSIMMPRVLGGFNFVSLFAWECHSVRQREAAHDSVNARRCNIISLYLQLNTLFHFNLQPSARRETRSRSSGSSFVVVAKSPRSHSIFISDNVTFSFASINFWEVCIDTLKKTTNCFSYKEYFICRVSLIEYKDFFLIQ